MAARCTHLEEAAVAVGQSCGTRTAGQRADVGSRGAAGQSSCKNSNTPIRLPESVLGVQSSMASFD